MVRSFWISVLALAGQVVADLTSASLEKHVSTLNLDASFKPIKPAYWTGYPHHRRTPFALSPDGTTAYIAYLDASETGVHVQQVDPTTFAATGSSVTVAAGMEAGGLVAHNDGFALLTNEAVASGTANAPPGNTPVPVLYRYTNGQHSWKTYLGGPGVHESDGLSMSPDLNGDLVYSEAAKMYGAYFVVTDYAGWAQGHFGDSIQYVTTDGTRQQIAGASSAWGCSHNTGIAFEAADTAPFASICAEDHGAIWLNTKTQGMDGVKISNENVQNGASNEPMGGMSGSYSGLARFINSNSYIFAWVSRGAIDLTQDTWRGAGYTQAANRTVNRNVAIATFSDKDTLNGPQAISTVGAASGDDQVDWVTQGSADTSNAHVAAFDSTNALVTWEEAANPTCPFIAMGCFGTFSGTYFQQVDNTGAKLGSPITSTDTYVAGDMVTFPNGKICWPYVDMKWSLAAASDTSATTSKISFACMNIGAQGSTSSSASVTASPSSSTTAATWSTESATSAAPTTDDAAASTSAQDEPTSTTTLTSTVTVTTTVPGSAEETMMTTAITWPTSAAAPSTTSVSSAVDIISSPTESPTFLTAWPSSSSSSSSSSVVLPIETSAPAPVPVYTPSGISHMLPTTTLLTLTQPAWGSATPSTKNVATPSHTGFPFNLQCWPIHTGRRGSKKFRCLGGGSDHDH